MAENAKESCQLAQQDVPGGSSIEALSFEDVAQATIM